MEYYKSIRVFMHGEDDQQALQGRTWTRNNQKISQYRSNECQDTRYMSGFNEDFLNAAISSKKNRCSEPIMICISSFQKPHGAVQ